MKILSAAQIREADAYTMAHEPITSIDLMERAARNVLEWLKAAFDTNRIFYIFCGPGNNGGDGLALARLLQHSGYSAHAFVLSGEGHISPDHQQNRSLMEHSFGSHLHAIHRIQDFPDLPAKAVVIDALFGTGLSRPLQGLAAELVHAINRFEGPVVAIDLPSGMFCDSSCMGCPVVRATVTLSFQVQKLAFLMAENEDLLGDVQLIPIGLHPGYLDEVPTSMEVLERVDIQKLRSPRQLFSHKGSFGHALLVAGSYGKMGAAVLASRACLRSGTGLLSCHVPHSGVSVLQAAFPEAMCVADEQEAWVSSFPQTPLQPYDAVGIGPGIGQHPETAAALKDWIPRVPCPLVLDADALNILSHHPDLMSELPAGTILTPHPREFERLFGTTSNQFERLDLQRAVSRKYHIVLVLKGHFSSIASPDGRCFFNPTGNPGMATAGTGDALTGLITGLLAQGYAPLEAAQLGVYLHGLAGDIAASCYGPEAMLASDLIQNLGAAFKSLE